MPTRPAFADPEPTRIEVDALTEPTVMEFGSPNCHWCIDAKPLIETALAAFPGVGHIRIHDGRGRPLGRSFGVKLWPTLIFMARGKEVARLVRPDSAGAIVDALEQIGRKA